jgi:hypothetical protein
MHMRIRALAISAALLQAFAFSAHAEELHKDGRTNSGVRLNYEATMLPSGQLQIDFMLECRQSESDPLYGVGAFAVINKAANPVNIQKNTLSCTAQGNLDKLPVSGKATGRFILGGVTAADIGTKVFVIGRVEKGKSPRTDSITKEAGEALQKEIDKVTAG